MTTTPATDAGLWTWANLVTFIRLALLPLFFWLLFDTGHRAWAAWLLGVLGATDWVDGYLARRLHQVSNVGKIIDPVADRVLVVAGLLAVAAAGGVPWWFAIATLVREVIVSVLTLVLAALGAARIDVLWWGKVSTFTLMATFPLFLLTSNAAGATPWSWQAPVRDACWVGGVIGLTMSWLVLLGYIGPARRALQEGRAARRVL
ncbi:MAG TPA: CDP-alcohol phosphatidyltransferase family protein [Acidimicrobiales bacterium]|nr:CDP-alcohol phosphatidyltransferase family protein [Acidimicrobiales bacterium]